MNQMNPITSLRRILLLVITVAIVFALFVLCFRLGLQDRFEAYENPSWLQGLQWAYAILGSLICALLVFRPFRANTWFKGASIFAGLIFTLLILIATPWLHGDYLPTLTSAQLSALPEQGRSLYPMARQGNWYGSCALAILLLNNHEDKEAAWYLKSAANGRLGEACMLLGQLYAEGRGVPKDEETSLHWLFSAIENGEIAAFDALKSNPVYQKRLSFSDNGRKLVAQSLSHTPTDADPSKNASLPATPTPPGTGIYHSSTNKTPLAPASAPLKF